MTDIEHMDDEDLLAQINCHDPYDVEFARRYRALLAERDRYKALAKRAEAALHNVYHMALEIECGDISGYEIADTIKSSLAQIDAEPAEPRQPTVQEAARVLLKAMRPDGIDEHAMRCFWQGSPFSALRALAEGDSQ